MKDIVLYDADCSFCKWTKNLIEKLDWFKKVKFLPLQHYQGTVFSQEELKKELHLVTKNGKVKRAFQAMRCILKRLPLTVILTPLLYLPGMNIVGNKIYFWIAARRTKLMQFLRKLHLDSNRSAKFSFSHKKRILA